MVNFQAYFFVYFELLEKVCAASDLCPCGLSWEGRSAGLSVCASGWGRCRPGERWGKSLLQRAVYPPQPHAALPVREQRERSVCEAQSSRLGLLLGVAEGEIIWVAHVLNVRVEENETQEDLFYPDFWHHSSESLRGVLTHQAWQVHDHTGSLDVLPRADHKTQTTFNIHLLPDAQKWENNL